MRANLIRTGWIIFQTVLITTNTCLAIIIKTLLGHYSHDWLDQKIRCWAKRILHLVRVNYQVYNPHHVEITKLQRCILMCNHTSLYDIPLSFATLPGSIRMLAKKELSRILVLGKAMQAASFPFIDRKNHHQAIKDLAQVKQLLAEDIIIWIAPEGTRSRTGKLGQLKKGGGILAIQTQATIVPIGIRGAHAILPAKTMHFHLNQHVEIHIGKPIDSREYNLANKAQLISNIEQQLLQLTGESEPETVTKLQF